MTFGYVRRCGWHDRRRGMRHDGRVEEVSRSQRLAVPWIRADGGKWTAINDGLNLHNEGAKGVNVERIQDALGRDVAVE